MKRQHLTAAAVLAAASLWLPAHAEAAAPAATATSAHTLAGLTGSALKQDDEPICEANLAPTNSPLDGAVPYGISPESDNSYSHPVAVSNKDGRVEAFAREDDGAIQHTWQTEVNGTTWSNWSTLEGVSLFGPTVARNEDGRLEMFSIGTNCGLWHRWQHSKGSDTWDSWKPLDHPSGVSLRALQAMTSNDGKLLHVFAVGDNHVLYHIAQKKSNGHWGSWENLGGDSFSTPALASESNGRIAVFVIDREGRLDEREQDSASTNTWKSWVTLESAVRLVGNPAVARNDDGCLAVFAQSFNGLLAYVYQNSKNSTSWTGPASLGGNVIDSPVAAKNHDGRIEVFAIGPDGEVHHTAQNAHNVHKSSGWSAWTSLGGLVKGPLTVAKDEGQGRLHVVAIDPAGYPEFDEQNAADSQNWTGWKPLPN